MKKHHACSEKAMTFTVLTLGSDIKVKCGWCGHEVTIPRVKLEKNIRRIEHIEPDGQPDTDK